MCVFMQIGLSSWRRPPLESGADELLYECGVCFKREGGFALRGRSISGWLAGTSVFNTESRTDAVGVLCGVISG